MNSTRLNFALQFHDGWKLPVYWYPGIGVKPHLHIIPTLGSVSRLDEQMFLEKFQVGKV